MIVESNQTERLIAVKAELTGNKLASDYQRAFAQWLACSLALVVFAVVVAGALLEDHHEVAGDVIGVEFDDLPGDIVDQTDWMFAEEIDIFLQDVADELQVIVQSIKRRDVEEFMEFLFWTGQLYVEFLHKLLVRTRNLGSLCSFQQMH